MRRDSQTCQGVIKEEKHLQHLSIRDQTRSNEANRECQHLYVCAEMKMYAYAQTFHQLFQTLKVRLYFQSGILLT